eukprot:TRINITY_DN2358_c0_g1_i1.p1 TRINITY_DN2358_c0_g1~~TRINITY_DN2358_c0_g1_i1.p1  ORF type:complete len:537 (-),score=121.75 TRINITY_DN2358_c0_g1_i1:1143-2753(-)
MSSPVSFLEFLAEARGQAGSSRDKEQRLEKQLRLECEKQEEGNTNFMWLLQQREGEAATPVAAVPSSVAVTQNGEQQCQQQQQPPLGRPLLDGTQEEDPNRERATAATAVPGSGAVTWNGEHQSQQQQQRQQPQQLQSSLVEPPLDNAQQQDLMERQHWLTGVGSEGEWDRKGEKQPLQALAALATGPGLSGTAEGTTDKLRDLGEVPVESEDGEDKEVEEEQRKVLLSLGPSVNGSQQSRKSRKRSGTKPLGGWAEAVDLSLKIKIFNCKQIRQALSNSAHVEQVGDEYRCSCSGVLRSPEQMWSHMADGHLAEYEWLKKNVSMKLGRSKNSPPVVLDLVPSRGLKGGKRTREERDGSGEGGEEANQKATGVKGSPSFKLIREALEHSSAVEQVGEEYRCQCRPQLVGAQQMWSHLAHAHGQEYELLKAKFQVRRGRPPNPNGASSGDSGRFKRVREALDHSPFLSPILDDYKCICKPDILKPGQMWAHLGKEHLDEFERLREQYNVKRGRAKRVEGPKALTMGENSQVNAEAAS